MKKINLGEKVSPKEDIEFSLGVINELLDNCDHTTAMTNMVMLSRDLRLESNTSKTIDNEEYENYMDRLDKMIENTKKCCICHKR